MLGLFKKSFLLALGSGILVKETVEKVATDLVNKGKSTTEEATKMTRDLVEQVKKDVELVQSKGTKRVERVWAGVGVTSRSEYKALEKRVKDLEGAYKSSK